MPSIVHLISPSLSIISKTSFDSLKLREIEKHPSRFFLVEPARSPADRQYVRGENIAMITPLSEIELEYRLDKIREKEKAAAEQQKAGGEKPRLVQPKLTVVPGGN